MGDANARSGLCVKRSSERECVLLAVGCLRNESISGDEYQGAQCEEVGNERPSEEREGDSRFVYAFLVSVSLTLVPQVSRDPGPCG